MKAKRSNRHRLNPRAKMLREVGFYVICQRPRYVCGKPNTHGTWKPTTHYTSEEVAKNDLVELCSRECSTDFHLFFPNN